MIERTFVKQAFKRIELENYLREQLKKAGFTRAEIMKTPLVTRIVINVTRPGLAIGKAGQNIRHLTEEIEEKFGIDNPQIEIKEIEVPELDAQAMADRITALIERGYSWRSVAYRAVKDIERAEAQGVEILLAGALGGKGGRKRKQRIASGYMKKVGDQAKLVDSAKAPAYAKFGAIGVKVKIVRPETVFPDKVRLENLMEERAVKEEETVKEKKDTGEKKAKEEKKAEKKKAPQKKKETGKKTEKKKEKTAKGEEKKTSSKKPAFKEKPTAKKKKSAKESGKPEKEKEKKKKGK